MGPCAAGADNSFEADLCLPTRQEFNRAVARVAQIEAILAEGAEALSTATRDRYTHERAQQQQLIDNYRFVKAWNKMPARKKPSLEQETPQRRWLLSIAEQRRVSAKACKWSQRREPATKSISRR